MRKLRRLFNRFYALLGGYFWIPCPVCGLYFGGHEASEYTIPIVNDNNSGMVVCVSCGEDYVRCLRTIDHRLTAIDHRLTAISLQYGEDLLPPAVRAAYEEEDPD